MLPFTVLSLAFVVGYTPAASTLDTVLDKDPVREAERAFAAGDYRHIVVPVCGQASGETLPGWPLSFSPAHLKAIENGKRPITCADLGPDTDRRLFVRITKYAEQYNQTLLRLSPKSPSK